MENNFEKELINVLNEEKEMPSVVRASIDNSYARIRSVSKKKNKVGLKIAAAVCCVVISGAMLTSKSVRASIRTFFNFNDKGVERAVEQGFSNESSSLAVDKSIKISLKSYFADSNKMGLSFRIKFDDAQILKGKIDDFSLFYRIKNGNGEYIAELIPDTKPLKGVNRYISSTNGKVSELDLTNNEVQYDEILESNEGIIPKLENTVVEIESVNIFYNTGRKNIEGKWNLELNGLKPSTVNSVEFKVKDNTSKIEIISAKSNPTSFNVTFAVAGKYEDENTFAGKNMKLIDDKGKEYMSSGYGMDHKNNKTIISTNFPVSSYENADKFKLVIASMGEVELTK